MTDEIKASEVKADESQVEVASVAEHLADGDDADSFPEEGTDDKTVQQSDTGALPFSDDEALKATRAVLDHDVPHRRD